MPSETNSEGSDTDLGRGSQYWLRRAVNQRSSALEEPILTALCRPNGRFEWKSPLLADGYRESRDNAAFSLVGLTPAKLALNRFWPQRGPVWDGLAVVDGKERLFIEAKAHIPELLSGGSRATPASLKTINQSLEQTRAALAPRSKGGWASSSFFQYANRLAFLQFLREHNELPAHLVFVYFTNDTGMGGPSTEAEWRGAIRLMEASLGLSAHRLTRYVHKVFVDVGSI